MNLLIYTEGGTFGLGHVIRCIHLARALVRVGLTIQFTTPANEPIGAERLRQEGYVVHYSFPYADAVLVDVEKYPGLEFMQMLRDKYRRIILVGGVSYPAASELESLVDLTIYQGELFDCPATDRTLNGPEYIIIDPAFSQCVPDRRGHILVSMGGRDPKQFTSEIINRGIGQMRNIKFVIGPAMDISGLRWASTMNGVSFKRKEDSSWDESWSYEFIKSPFSLVPYVNGASLAIVTTGMTAYECLAAGVPCILFNISFDHERTAAGLQERGCAVNMGLGLDPNRLKAGVDSAGALFELMSRSARALVDGKGAARVAEAICRIMA